jgi:hypothetical protein
VERLVSNKIAIAEQPDLTQNYVPTLLEALQTFRMFSKHERKTLSYDADPYHLAGFALAQGDVSAMDANTSLALGSVTNGSGATYRHDALLPAFQKLQTWYATIRDSLNDDLSVVGFASEDFSSLDIRNIFVAANVSAGDQEIEAHIINRDTEHPDTLWSDNNDGSHAGDDNTRNNDLIVGSIKDDDSGQLSAPAPISRGACLSRVVGNIWASLWQGRRLYKAAALVVLLAASVSPMERASADETSLADILHVMHAGKIEVQFCNNEALGVDVCQSLANAIADGATPTISPIDVVAKRQDLRFLELGSKCPKRGTSVAGLPMTLYDQEVRNTRTTAFGPFKVFDLSGRYSAWQHYSLVLASGFARKEEDYSAGHSFSWIVPYVIPKAVPCDGLEIGALFVGDSGQPSTSLRHAELVDWDEQVLLVSFQSELGLGIPVYVTAYVINSEPSHYMMHQEVLAPILAFIATE